MTAGEYTRAMDLSGRVVAITGASRGVGAGIAQTFFEGGARLALCARGKAAVAASDRVLCARVDVTDEAAVDGFAAAAFDRFGHVDLWVNNAGMLEPIAPLREVAVERWREHIDINVTGVFLGTRAYVRHVRASGKGGVLVNISSGAARSGYAGWSAYCAGKAAVDLLTEAVQLEEADAGLRAYAVAPGVIDTAMQELIRGADEAAFPLVEKFRAMKRDDTFSTPGFVAARLAELAFDPAHRPDTVRVRFPPEKS